MESIQMLASKNSQENVTSNNARSVNDCSSSGLSLQRKANVAQNSSSVIQRDAWVATKALDWLVEKDKCDWASEGDLCDTTNVKDKGVWYEKGEIPRKADTYVDSTKTDKEKRRNYESRKLAYNDTCREHHHRHFIFSPMDPKVAPSEKEKEVHKKIHDLTTKYHSVASRGNPTDNNIGFESENGGKFDKGALFSDDILHRGYTLREKISDNPEDDMNLVNAMQKHTPDTDFAQYNLFTKNCQHWVEKVRDDAGL